MVFIVEYLLENLALDLLYRFGLTAQFHVATGLCMVVTLWFILLMIQSHEKALLLDSLDHSLHFVLYSICKILLDSVSETEAQLFLSVKLEKYHFDWLPYGFIVGF